MPLTNDTAGNVAQVGRLGPTQAPTVVSTSTQSTALADSRCYAVRLMSTVDCYIAIGTNPTATTTSTRLVAFQPEYFGARLGDKVATLRTATDGVISITELI